MRVTATARGGNRRRRAGGKGGAAGFALAAAAAVAVTGCSSNSSNLADPLPSRTSASPSSPPASSAPTSPTDAVLAQYRAFWAALTPASQAPASKRRAMLAPYAADPELKSLLDGMRRADSQGEVFYGADVPRPTVQTISTGRGVAVIRDCQDSSHAGNAKRSSGTPVTVGVARHLVVSTMHLLPDGKWRVVFVSYPNGSC